MRVIEKERLLKTKAGNTPRHPEVVFVIDIAYIQPNGEYSFHWLLAPLVDNFWAVNLAAK